MKKERIYDDVFRVFIVVITAVVYALGVIWFLEPASLYSAGLTGISQIIVNIFANCGITNNFISVGTFVFVLNVPVIIVGYKYVSKRFSIYSIISVVVQTIVLSKFFENKLMVDFGINMIGNPNYSPLACSLVGGLITGFACGVALRYGTSTGGLDILAQAFAFKDSRISIGTSTMVVNILIAVIGGGFISGDLSIVLFTFIRIIISSIVTDKVHTAYNYLEINAITTMQTEMVSAIFNGINRGCTIIPVEGAYTHERKWDLLVVVSSYELYKTIKICKSIDPNAFITVSPIKTLFGNFAKKSII